MNSSKIGSKAIPTKSLSLFLKKNLVLPEESKQERKDRVLDIVCKRKNGIKNNKKQREKEERKANGKKWGCFCVVERERERRRIVKKKKNIYVVPKISLRL